VRRNKEWYGDDLADAPLYEAIKRILNCAFRRHAEGDFNGNRFVNFRRKLIYFCVPSLPASVGQEQNTSLCGTCLLTRLIIPGTMCVLSSRAG
jgi:hypothetical protein